MNRTINPSSICPACRQLRPRRGDRRRRQVAPHVGCRAGATRRIGARRGGEQAEVIWQNIGAMLDEAGMRAADIVSVTTYAVVGEPLADVMARSDRFLGGRRVASTLVTVPALAQPARRMEIAIVAAA
ncbi:MAG: Rid family hydrolase [Ilumatobacteraceae bacterium]